MCAGASEPSSSSTSATGLQTEQLLAAAYDDLRRLAAHRIATMAPGQTLQATALVHEVWLRLASKDGGWESRTHFFATAAEMIRHILVDHIRGKARLKRGGGQLRLDIDALDVAEASPDEKVLLIDEALQQLQKEQPDKARVVVLKFFGGLSNKEAAESLNVTERTIERHWAYAKAWLITRIRENSAA